MRYEKRKSNFNHAIVRYGGMRRRQTRAHPIIIGDK